MHPATVTAEFEISHKTPAGRRSYDLLEICVPLLILCVMIRRWPRGASGLTLFQDDFFYYEKIASAIAHGQGSTFNHLNLTNGYHPLWLGVLVILTTLFHTLNGVIGAAWVLVGLSLWMTFLLSRRVFSLLFQSNVTSDVLALCVTLLSFNVVASGMEVVLTVPLALALLNQLLKRRTDWLHVLILSALSSLLVLSRLDSAILVFILGICLVILFRPAITPRGLMAVACGMLPLGAYLCVNEILFHVLLPISGAAKQLRTTHRLSFTPAISLTHLPATGKLTVLVVVMGVLLLPFGLRKVDRLWQAILLACIAFPFAHLVVLSFASDWPMWPWYLYSWIIGSLGATALFAIVMRGRNQQIFVGIMGAFSLLLALQVLKQKPALPHGRVLAGYFLQNFSASHPGVYAMGDRSGIASVLIQDPIIQTEGLVMDKNFLIHLQRQDPLIPTLRSYGVRYYVANFYNRTAPSGCFQAIEPTMAGRTAKHMSSVLCDAPVAQFTNEGVDVAVYDLLSTPSARGAGL